MTGQEIKRVYRYFNVEDNRYGQPFILCDFHRKTYNPPAMQDGSCVLTLLANEANGNCEFCGHEPE